MWFDFKQFIAQQDLIQPEDQLLVALSGGVDSMVLAHILLKSGVSFEVAHCNFRLRGRESDGDEDFVKSWCNRNGLKGHFKKFGLPGSNRL